MSRPNWKAKYVHTRSMLPEKLTRGRAYFIGDEGIILVRHGRSTKEYGGMPGPQGKPGDPDESLREQVADLSEAVMLILNILAKPVIFRDDSARRDIASLAEAVSGILGSNALGILRAGRIAEQGRADIERLAEAASDILNAGALSAARAEKSGGEIKADIARLAEALLYVIAAENTKEELIVNEQHSDINQMVQGRDSNGI